MGLLIFGSFVNIVDLFVCFRCLRVVPFVSLYSSGVVLLIFGGVLLALFGHSFIVVCGCSVDLLVPWLMLLFVALFHVFLFPFFPGVVCC